MAARKKKHSKKSGARSKRAGTKRSGAGGKATRKVRGAKKKAGQRRTSDAVKGGSGEGVVYTDVRRSMHDLIARRFS